MAGGYDGEIRIRTLIENGKASSQLLQLEAKFQKTAKEAAKLEDEMRKLEQQKIPTEEYKDISDALHRSTLEFDKLLQRQDDMVAKGKTSGATWDVLDKKIEKVGADILAAEEYQRQMIREGTAYKEPKATAEYQKLSEKLSDANSRMNILKRKMEEVAAKQAKVGSGSKQIVKVGKAAKKTAGLMSTLLSRLKGITLSLFIFNWITKGFNAMVAAFKSGIQNMAKYSGDFNSKMSEMKSATATLKASLGTLAAPIVSAIVPAIVTLCNWLTTAINKINMLIAALSGKSTWTRAKKQQVDYAKSLNSTAAAAKKAAGALQGFDELNVINSNSDSSGGVSGGASGSGYEEVPLTEKDFAWINKVKSAFEKLLSAIQPVTDALKNLWENGLKKLGGFSYDALLGFYEHFLVPVGKWVLGEGLPRFINALNDGLMKIDFDKITDALNKLWDALAPFAINVGEGLLWFWENVLVPLGTWVANEVVPRFLETVANCIDILNTVIEALKPTFQWFWENVLQPIAEWAADKFLEAWDAINDALKKFGDWCSEHEEVIQTIAILVISFGAAIGIVNAALAIWNGVCAIAAAVTTLFGKAIVFLTSPIGLVILAITALIAIGLLLYKNWDEIKAKATEIWEKIKETISEKISNIKEKIKSTLENIKEAWTEKWSNMKTTVVDIFKGIWSGIKGTINNIIGGIEKMVNSVISGLNTMIEAMNKLSWDIPDWVPAIGGNSFGLNIPTVNTVSIPRLANGGITTGSTLANIGEAGREAVLPLENNLSYLEPLAEMIASKMEGVQTVRVVADKNNVFKVVREEANSYYRRTGNPAFNF